jgi:MFS family permease
VAGTAAAAGAGAVSVPGGGRWRGVGRLVPAPLLALAATIVGAALVEGGTSDWAALQLQRYGASAGVAALGVAAFMAGMLAGRSVGDKLDERWGGARLLRTGGLLVAGGLAAGALLPYAAVFIAGAFVAGVGSSGFFPLAFSAAARIPGVAPGVGAATVSLAARLGFTVEPALMGGIADSVGLRWAYGMVAAIGLVMALAAGRVVPAEATSRGR